MPNLKPYLYLIFDIIDVLTFAIYSFFYYYFNISDSMEHLMYRSIEHYISKLWMILTFATLLFLMCLISKRVYKTIDVNKVDMLAYKIAGTVLLIIILFFITIGDMFLADIFSSSNDGLKDYINFSATILIRCLLLYGYLKLNSLNLQKSN
jgi:hypothetical protein